MSFIWILSPALFYSIYAYLRLNFLNIKSFSSAKDIFKNSYPVATNTQSKLYLYFLRVSILLFAVLSPYILYNELTTTVVALKPGFLLFLLFLISYLVINKSSSSDASQFTPIAVLLVILSAVALVITNAVQLYILLEVVAYTNLLFLSLQYVDDCSSKRHNLIALTISFILNFIASILMFSAFAVIMWEESYLTWWVFNSTALTGFEGVLLGIAVLVKLGTGPWLAGNYQTYLGYKLNYLLVYTVISVVMILPILLGLLKIVPSALMLVAVVMTLLYISQTLASVTSLKGLFAYSTVIFHTYILVIIL